MEFRRIKLERIVQISQVGGLHHRYETPGLIVVPATESVFWDNPNGASVDCELLLLNLAFDPGAVYPERSGGENGDAAALRH